MLSYRADTSGHSEGHRRSPQQSIGLRVARLERSPPQSGQGLHYCASTVPVEPTHTQFLAAEPTMLTWAILYGKACPIAAPLKSPQVDKRRRRPPHTDDFS